MANGRCPVTPMMIRRCRQLCIAELEKCKQDAENNRSDDDGSATEDEWNAFIEGIECCIYRLKLNNRCNGG